MLHNKPLSANNPGENFQDIEGKINAATTNKEMADVIAKYREEMVSILKTNEAEETQDENTLNGLITKLKEKRALLETDLGKTPPCKIDLSDNTAITDFWKSIIDGSNPDLKTGIAATPAEKKDVNDKITEALGKIQFVHDDSKGDVEKIFKLFKGGSTEITDIAKTTSNPLIQQLLDEKDPTKIDSTIDKFINSVKSTKGKTGGGNPFFISTTKLDEKGKDSERKVALRVVLYLYFIHRLANPVKGDKFKLTSALCTDINDKLDQLMNNEIPKIKGLHNTKVELGYLEPEYDTLKELNTKKGDIDQGTHNLGATALDLPINLTSEFETASPLTKDIDEYKIIENDAKITDAGGTVYKTYFLDGFGKTGDLFAQLASSTTPSVDLCIEVSGQKVKLGKLTLSNVSGNAQLKIDIDNEATIKAAFAAAGATMPSGNLDFEIPVKGIKNVSNGLTGCKAALTKNVKIALAPAGGPTPIPIPIPPVTVNDLEIDATISDMGTDVLKEKVAHDVEEELRKEYKGIAKGNVFKRAYFFLARGQMRNKRVKKKLADISGKAFTGDTAIDAHTQNAADRHELEKLKGLDADIKNIDEISAITYQNQEINDLCKKYIQTWGVTPMSDSEFQTKFNEILERDTNLKDKLNKANVTHMGTNILLKMKQKVARKDLIGQVSNNLNEYDKTKSDIYINNINTAIQNYIRNYQDNSEKLMAVYNDFLGDKTDTTKLDSLKQYLSHQQSVMTLTTSNIKIKLDIIKGGKSAYQIDNKNREKSWKYKLGNWMDKHPLWTTVGTVGASIGLGALTGGLGAVAGAIVTTAGFAGLVGTTNAVKKWTHHTKEQNTHEKDLVTDHANEMRKVQERIDTMNNGKGWKKYKAKRQLKLYHETTQSKIAITNILSDDITNISSKIGVLSSDDEKKLKYYLIEGRARLKYYREVGHNFLASNDRSKTEEDFNKLEKSIYLGINKLGARDPSDIESYSGENKMSQTVSFNDIYNEIKDDFVKTDKTFRDRRRKLSIKYGVCTAGLSALTALGMQYITHSGVFAGKGTEAVAGYNSTNSISDNFELGKHELLDTGTRNEIYNGTKNALSGAPEGSTLNIHYGAGTDATGFINTPPTSTDLTTKIQTVSDNINGMSGLTDIDKGIFIKEVANLSGGQGTNGVLQNMRHAEFLEQAAQALSDSGQSGKMAVSLIHDSGLDVVGTTVHSAPDRVVNGMIEITKAEIPGKAPKTWGKRLMGMPTFFNTFKDREAA